MAAVLAPREPATQKVILHNISWQTYERLLAENAGNSSTHFAYDQGRLEIMILSLKHERLKDKLMTIIGTLAEELRIDSEGAGSTTFRREDIARGFEPDACYYFTHLEEIRAREDIDLASDPVPDLVVEVDISRPSLDKLPILASMGVAEVWRYVDGQVLIYRLRDSAYVNTSESVWLPGVTALLVQRLLEAGNKLTRLEWLQSVRLEMTQNK